MVCGVDGSICNQETLSDGRKPCDVCTVGKEWLDKNNGVKFHDED